MIAGAPVRNGRGARYADSRRTVVGVVLGVVLTVPVQDVQGQWWPFRRKKDPPAAPAPSQGAASTAVTPTPVTPAQEAVRSTDLNRYLTEARARDLNAEVTVQNAQARLDAWSIVLAIDAEHPAALAGVQRARQDLEAARQKEADLRTQAADSVAQQAVRAKLQSAEGAMRQKEFDRAQAEVEEVLASYPGNTRAQLLKDEITRKRSETQERNLWLAAGGVFLLAGAGAAALARRVLHRKREQDAAAAARPPVITVVDGVGTGRFIYMQNHVCRIGAADAADESQKNDLVISDSGAVISRHHCMIVRKEGEYFLIDSSTNGTQLNEERLARGKHHRLHDGDEIVIADASRLKFLLT